MGFLIRRRIRRAPGATTLGHRVVVLALVGAFAGGGITFVLGSFQQASAHATLMAESAATAMLSGVLAQNSALQQYARTGDETYGLAYVRAGDAVDSAQAEASGLMSGAVAVELRRTAAAVQLWQEAAELAKLRLTSDGGQTRVPGETRLRRRFAKVERDVTTVNSAFAAQGLGSMSVLRDAATAAMVLLSALIGFAASRWIVRRVEDEQRVTASAQSFVGAQAEFADAIQMAEVESEVHELLVRQLERVMPGAHTTILRSNNSANRLEATPELPKSATAAPAGELRPHDCLAIRLGRPFYSSTEESSGGGLVRCKLCAESGSRRLCVPSVVRGEVIGSVLVAGDCECSDEHRRRVESTVTQASPVLGNLRTLALAESRAGTDSLTGLPNKRSFDDALERFSAAAGRSVTPLSALMLDIDHFKRINDGFGHARGDYALAAVASGLERAIRASDFVARFGGEEFVILLPDTDAAGAVQSAEKIRLAIASLPLAEIGSLTVSIGVASIPHHAHDGNALVRAADHALYKAKETRNRVEVADEGPSTADADLTEIDGLGAAPTAPIG
jgi:diguanylate cyclase (GGDEF)-like protein